FGFSLEEALKTHCVPNFPITIDVETSQGDKLQLEVDVYLSNKTQQHDETPLNRDDSLNFSEGLLILIRDVTEIARLKRRNERDSRMRLLGEMAAVVAHEIRNPLAGIKGFASLLVEDLSDRPALVEMAKSIVEGVDGLNRIVTNILNYARPLEPKYVSTDLPQLIETLIASLKTDPKMETISISSSYTPEKFAMEIDPHLIRSALLNLLLNAVQAIDERGSIKIHSFFDGNGCILTIEDSGVGMSEKQLERLFVPFFTTKANGSGLGLAEVHKIVQAHEGTIHADSSPGAGARFVLFLPNHRSQDCTDSIPSPKSNYPEGELRASKLF
ncbi:MAG: GHKL domain-containing protein, partial [Chlamydiia bacterium]|nr:GHKL domain-containing protein [Chlamydiia bacterium]